MAGTIPADTDEQKERVARLKKMTPAKNAPLAVFLASDAAHDITGQVFGTRHNEIFVFDPYRPVRSVHRSEGWGVQAIADHAVPALQAHFAALDRSGDVFSWDPL